ncbi:hypothetical protein MF271_00660 (plasmid) [Deinococcus sp. KNUC1210]|uniref:hypothetical protein n=1 Tax=Deinococcus sp. KNUC1210 TaxID=2917691 RepID=UPI001EF08395|nr:hypothetical protein [Deinococcus sp. KNUC1210]ULH14024.1 hypothetical protein MF271_00660 [Deinococcus sp. KNUC1210]
MSWPETSLSWSAILVGWSEMFQSVHDLSELAEHRILSAEGEAVIPLSDLIGMATDANRQEPMPALQRLAALEGRPTFFARREWMAYRLQWQLDQLGAVADPEEPELSAYWQVLELVRCWEDFGAPLDVPPFSPFVLSYVELSDPEGGITRTVRDVHAWIDDQRSLLEAVDRLLTAGMTNDINLLARAFERALASAQAHLQLRQAELTLARQTAGNDPLEEEQIKRYNLEMLAERRQG